MKHRSEGRFWPCLLLMGGLLAAEVNAQVTLPLSDYEALRARAEAEPEDPPEPPVPFALEEARLRIEVEKTSARIVQALTLSLLEEKWQTLPVQELGTFVQADLGALEGLLREDGGLSLRVRGSGRHRLTLESVVTVEEDERATRPTWRLALNLPEAAVVSGEIFVPASVEAVEAEEGGLVLPSEEDGRWVLTGAPGERLVLRLQGSAEAPDRGERPLAFEATATTGVGLTRARQRVESWIDLRVSQGRLETLRVPIPHGLELVEVALGPGSEVGPVSGPGGGTSPGPGVGWDVVDGTAVVQLSRPVEDRATVYLRLTGPPAEELVSPLLAPEGAEQVRTFSAVSVTGDGLLSLADSGSGRAAGERWRNRLPSLAQELDGLLLEVADAERPPRWRISWADGAEVLAVQVDDLLVDVLLGSEGRTFYQLWISVRNNGADSLSLQPPEGFALVACRRNDVSCSPGAAGSALVLPLAVSDESQVLYLSGFLPGGLPERADRVAVTVPSFSAPVARVAMRVLLPRAVEASLVEAAKEGWAREVPVSSTWESWPRLAQELFGPARESLERYALASELLPVPPGYRALEAAWSALSPEPSPLIVKLNRERTRKEWF